jgi:hypothetical protein
MTSITIGQYHCYHCSFLTIFEEIVAKKLTMYLCDNNLLTDAQYGFSANHSTIHPMTKPLNMAAAALNKKDTFWSFFVIKGRPSTPVTLIFFVKKLSKLGTVEVGNFEQHFNFKTDLKIDANDFFQFFLF